MDNILLCAFDLEIEKLSKELGFTKTLFLGRDLVLVSGSKKDILKQTENARRAGKMTVYEAKNEEEARFVLEKTRVDLVFGLEKVHVHDSLHYLRSGLDQVLCKIAHDNEKQIGFSFREILESGNRGKIIGRMMFNSRLCKKYKIPIIFSNFSNSKEEMRGVHDLEAWKRLLEKRS